MKRSTSAIGILFSVLILCAMSFWTIRNATNIVTLQTAEQREKWSQFMWSVQGLNMLIFAILLVVIYMLISIKVFKKDVF